MIDFEKSSEQYCDFLNSDNFILAYKRLQTAGRNLYKSVYMHELKIFGVYLEKNVENLVYQIKEKSYSYGKSLKYYLPKANGAVRPITLPTFTDLLIYQALINVISKVTVGELKDYYNKALYGNILNEIDNEDSIFLFKQWKKQWRKYSELHDEFFSNGFVYLCEFDISSFFDTINHEILKQILLEYGVSGDVANTLIDLLFHVSKDDFRKTYYSSTGIPQGPIASFYLADLYLHYIDKKLIDNTLGPKSEMKYIRYVDDIKIYTKNEFERDKRLSQLELLSRDIALIPQSSKIAKRKMDNPEREVRNQFKQFSKWADEHRKGNYNLKKSTHKKLKRLLFKEISKKNGKFKTVLSYSMYKLNKDDDIKNYIFENFSSLLCNIESILFYLNKHYNDDSVVKSKIKEYLMSNKYIFDHVYAMIFKYFHNIDYDTSIFDMHYKGQDQYWLKKYYMLDWLYRNNKEHLIMSLSDDVEIVNRRINYFKSKIVSDYDTRVLNMNKLIVSSNTIDALSAIYYYDNEFTVECIFKGTEEKGLNKFINNILKDEKVDFINDFFRSECNILNSNYLFNETVFESESYSEMKKTWITFCNYRKIDSSVAFMNINIFNHILVVQLNKFFEEIINSKEYGSMLTEIKWPSNLMTLRDTFIEINNWRNQKTYSHPFNKDGKIRVKIKYNELENYVAKEIKALKELILYFEKNH